MAASVYKWLILSVALLNFSSFKATNTIVMDDEGTNPHPFFVCVTEINHNAADKTLEISIKAFADDFDKVLHKKYNAKVDFVKPADKAALDKIIADYITRHLSIRADGKNTSFTYLGYEKDEDAVYSYLQVNNISSVKKLDVIDSLLHDLNDNQVNILHVTVGGNRKSTKLDFPNTEASFVF